MSDKTLPFYALDPDLILSAIESMGIAADGRLLALNSYENRVYQVGVESGPSLVVKFYRPNRWDDQQILEEHSFLNELAENEIPVVAPILFDGFKSLCHYRGFRYAVFPKHGGRAPDLDREGVLEWIGRFIGRIHSLGAIKPFESRPVISVESFLIEPSRFLLDNGFIPADLIPAYNSVLKLALDGVLRCFERAGDVSTIRLHGDCHMGNVLWTDLGPHFVDFDDCRMGPAIQDLWMMLSGTHEDMSEQFQEILLGYADFYDFNFKELHLIEALRTLRLVHYSGWIASRWDDPAFKQSFTWFNTQQYWQDRILEMREQVSLMNEPPLSLKFFTDGNR